MFAYTLALQQSGPRFDGSAITTLIGVLVIGALALVFWASRPSVTARYSATARAEEEKPAPPVDPENHA